MDKIVEGNALNGYHKGDKYIICYVNNANDY